jgi:hypothetical protein
MAIVQNPIVSRASGRVGTSVFSKWKKKNTIKSISINPYPAPTPAQASQRSKFMYFTNFFTSIKQLLPLLFTSSKGRMSPYNMCMRSNISLFTDDGSLVLEPDVHSLIFSKGSLPAPYDLLYTIGGFEGLNISFSIEIYQDISTLNIKSYLFIYDFSTHTLRAYPNGAAPYMQFIIPTSEFIAGNRYFVFYSYYSEIAKLSSDSLFCCTFIY